MPRFERGIFLMSQRRKRYYVEKMVGMELGLLGICLLSSKFYHCLTVLTY